MKIKFIIGFIAGIGLTYAVSAGATSFVKLDPDYWDVYTWSESGRAVFAYLAFVVGIIFGAIYESSD